MESTIFLAAVGALILAVAFLLMSRTGAASPGAAEVEPDTARGEAHWRRYRCEGCSNPFLFVTFEGGPVREPTCPFCHSTRARPWKSDDQEPVSRPTRTEERERVVGEETTASSTSTTTAVADDEPWEEYWRRRWSPWN